MAIQNLTQGTLTEAASLPFYDPANGADRRASITALATLLQGMLTSGGVFLTQYAAPNATGFSVLISPLTSGQSVFLLLTPAGAYATGTIVLPAEASCVDTQEVLISCGQFVTALTVNGNGATVNGAPLALAGNDFFRLRFDGVNRAWYRVG